MNIEDEKNAILWELNRRNRDEKLRYFVPNGAQIKFIEAFKKPGKKTIIFAAANGIGKTCSAMVMLAAVIWPELAEHKVFDGIMFKHWNDEYFGSPKFPKRIRIISTSKEIEEIGSVQEEIRKWFPKGRYWGEKSGKPYVSKYRTDNGWLIDIMSYDMDKQQFEGATLGIVLFNEPPPKLIYTACMLRLRMGGKVLMPMTPLFDAGWIQDDIIDGEHTEKVEVIEAGIEENCIEHGTNGILKHADIEQMIEDCDEDEKEARIHGKFMHLANRIFSVFNRSVHVAKEIIVPPKTLEVETYQIVDPAAGKPFAIIWAYTDKSGFKHIYDEWPNTDFTKLKESKETVATYKELFKTKETIGGVRRKVDVRILDRHYGNNRSEQTGLTLKENFEDEGIDFIDSYNCDNEVETGIQKVKDDLGYNKKEPLSALNRPKLIISPHCTNTIKSMEKFCRNHLGRPKDDHWKDFCDVVRYYCVYSPELFTAERPHKKKDNYNTNDPFNQR